MFLELEIDFFQYHLTARSFAWLFSVSLSLPRYDRSVENALRPKATDMLLRQSADALHKHGNRNIV